MSTIANDFCSSTGYFVQEYKTTEGSKVVMKNNGYKNGTIKNIMKVLEPLFIGKPGEYFLHDREVTSAPPEFPGYEQVVYSDILVIIIILTCTLATN